MFFFRKKYRLLPVAEIVDPPLSGADPERQEIQVNLQPEKDGSVYHEAEKEIEPNEIGDADIVCPKWLRPKNTHQADDTHEQILQRFLHHLV